MDDQMRGPVERVNSQVDEMVRRMNASAVFGEPVQQGDVTLIPVAAVTYGFGTGQGWGRSKPEESPAEAPMDEGGGGGVIAMQVGVKTAYVNGKSYTIDAPPVIVNGRTFVPIRFISEMFNATVTYEQATRTVTIVRDFLPK